MLKIITGTLGGRRIESPADERVRPTTGRVRESLFASLVSEYGGSLSGCRFLDLFAGSGLMGFEALSRQADRVVAVEQMPAHCRLIQKNAETLGVAPPAFELVCDDVLNFVAKPRAERYSEPFDIIFLDPPYGFSGMRKTVERLLANGWLAPDGVLIAEQERRDPPLAGAERKVYGDTILSIVRSQPEASP
jgi:16S rRNA (guanine966-N2)-methyltransferase